jgi:glycosyltransferase involved in cell wall biosynthesis
MPERRRILFLAPFPPDPDGTHGGCRAVGELIDQLAGRIDAAVLHMRAPGEPPMPEALTRRLALVEEVMRPDLDSTPLRRAAGLVRAVRGLSAGRPAWASDWRAPALAGRVAEIVHDWRPHVVQADFHVMGQYLPAARGAAQVLVEHEAGAAAAAELARWEGGIRGLARRVDAVTWRLYERRVIAGAGATVTFTERDRALLKRLDPTARIVRIPLGVRIPGLALDPVGANPPRVLFVGNFAHPPNVQSAVDLARSIFPLVSARRPEARLELVGEDPPPAVLRLAGPRVAVRGGVPDPRPYLDRAALVAVPARIGGGMRVKVLEALAAGKAVVATRRALAGIDLVPGEHALVGDSDRELADGIVELLDDPERRGRIAAAGRAWAAANLRWGAAADAYTELYESLLRARPPGTDRPTVPDPLSRFA